MLFGPKQRQRLAKIRFGAAAIDPGLQVAAYRVQIILLVQEVRLERLNCTLHLLDERGRLCPYCFVGQATISLLQ